VGCEIADSRLKNAKPLDGVGVIEVSGFRCQEKTKLPLNTETCYLNETRHFLAKLHLLLQTTRVKLASSLKS
jgi:hypothetical protein